MVVREVRVKGVLVRSRVPGVDYSVNPYVGCVHGCRYCYVAGMPYVRTRCEEWGTFADAKVNAPEHVARGIRRLSPGVLVIGVATDPYQPPEAEFRVTRGILEALAAAKAPGRGIDVRVLTKSPLVLRDVDLLRALGAEVGLSVTTDSEDIRRIFEPGAPAIRERAEALRELKRAGLRTYAFVGPMLPMDPERLVGMLSGAVDRVVLDRMNYRWRVRDIYHAHDLAYALEEDFFLDTARELVELFAREGIPAEPTPRWAARLRRDSTGL